MAWSLSLSPNFPFSFSLLLISLALSISSIVVSSANHAWLGQNRSFIVVIFHHLAILAVYLRHDTTLRSQNVRASKFYVRVLWVPIVFLLLFLGNTMIHIPQYEDVIVITAIVQAAVQSVVLLSLVLTAQYHTGGSITLPLGTETEPTSSQNRTHSATQPAPIRLFTSQYTLSESCPFSALALGVSLVLASAVIYLSSVDQGTASFGLNIVTPLLGIAFILFITLIYADVTFCELNAAQPFISRRSPWMSCFLRVNLRPVYLILVGFLDILLFIGATVTGYHWVHYCHPTSYGCWLKAPGRRLLLEQSVLGYALCFILFFGMILPLVLEHNERLEVSTPGHHSPNPHIRFVFKPTLFILSWAVIFPGFYFGLAQLQLEMGDGFDAVAGFSTLFLHHLIVAGVYLFIRDYDRETYTPTLLTKTACRFYTWSLVIPLFFLITDAAMVVQMLYLSVEGEQHYEAELVCDLFASLVLVLMITTAVYPSPPQSSCRDEFDSEGTSIGEDLPPDALFPILGYRGLREIEGTRIVS